MISPLKDSLNDFKSLGEVQKLIPKGSVVDSYLLFGGNIELQLAATDRFVIAHTDKFVVYEFWKSISEEAWRVADIVKRLYPLEEEKQFYVFQEHWPTYKDPAVRSAIFFLLNRCSRTGRISSGEFSNKNFNPMAVSRLNSFVAPEALHLKFNSSEDLVESVSETTEADYKLIPAGRFNYNLLEYGINKGFETSEVHHRKLCAALKKDKQKWVLLYKNHTYLHKLFKDFRIIKLNKYGTPVVDPALCEELIIANF